MSRLYFVSKWWMGKARMKRTRPMMNIGASNGNGLLDTTAATENIQMNPIAAMAKALGTICCGCLAS